jgi:hypothetical protein
MLIRSLIRRLHFAVLAIVLVTGASGFGARSFFGFGGAASPVVTVNNFSGLDGSSTPPDVAQVAYWDSGWRKIAGSDGSILQCDNSDGSTKPNCPAHKFIFYTEDWGTGYNIGTAGKTWGGFLAYETDNFKSGNPVNLGTVITPTQFPVCTPSGGNIYPDCQALQVLYNTSTGLYVGWFPTFESTAVVGIEVVTCPTPYFYGNGTSGAGCTIVGPATFSGILVKPIDTFGFLQRADGVAFVVASDAGVPGPGNFNVRVWKLNSGYTDTVGSPGPIIVDSVEAVGILERSGTVYVTWGALCAYCNGTPMYYATAPASDNLESATWTSQGQISAYSCGGQPFQVHTVWLNGNNHYLFTPLRYRAKLSALGTNPGYFNQGLSNFSLAELSFTGAALNSLDPCPSSVAITGLPDTAPPSPPTGAIEQDYVIAGDAPGYNDWGNIGSAGVQVGEVFTAQSSGARGHIVLPAFQACSGVTSDNNCDATRSGGAADLTVTIAPWTGTAPGSPLCSANISSASLPYVATDLAFACAWTAVSGTQYVWYLSGNNDAGGFGWVYDDHNTLQSIDANAKAVLSIDGGSTWTTMSNTYAGTRSLRFALTP